MKYKHSSIFLLSIIQFLSIFQLYNEVIHEVSPPNICESYSMKTCSNNTFIHKSLKMYTLLLGVSVLT